MQTIQAVIFDRDNVLVYFDKRAAMAYFEPLLPVSLEELVQIWYQWYDPADEPTTLSEENLLMESFWDHVGQHLNLSPTKMTQLHQFDYTTVVKAFPDALLALQFVKQQGLHVGVLSNFELASIDASLEAAGLAEWVDVAMAAPVIGVSKPDPEAYLTVTRALGVAPEACLFFDDHAPWIDGARAVGMQAYWLDRTRSEHALLENIVCDLSAVQILLTA